MACQANIKNISLVHKKVLLSLPNIKWVFMKKSFNGLHLDMSLTILHKLVLN